MPETKSGTQSAADRKPVAAKKAAEAKEEAAKAPVEEKPAPKAEKAEAKAEPTTVTEFTFDGVRAVDTVTDENGNTSTVARDASFEEQVGVLAYQVLEQAVGIVHLAASGTVETDGNVITITLEPR